MSWQLLAVFTFLAYPSVEWWQIKFIPARRIVSGCGIGACERISAKGCASRHFQQALQKEKKEEERGQVILWASDRKKKRKKVCAAAIPKAEANKSVKVFLSVYFAHNMRARPGRWIWMSWQQQQQLVCRWISLCCEIRETKSPMPLKYHRTKSRVDLISSDELLVLHREEENDGPPTLRLSLQTGGDQ